MVSTSICYGFFGECPKKCDTDDPKKSQGKCFVYRTCYHDWINSGKKSGLNDLLKFKED